MVALAIVAVALTALLGLRNRSLSMAAFAHHLTEATLLANARIADLSTRGASATGTTNGEAAPYRWIEEIRPTPLDGVREAVVTVLWQEGAHEEQVGITTYLFDAQTQ